MAYYKDSVHKPWSIDDEQDMWVASISYKPKHGDGNDVHFDCIEVRASEEILLNARVSVILDALNNPTLFPA